MFGMVGATMLLALREIRRHILRSFLTTLGIIIGVAAVITMVTLGRGLTASVQEDIAGLGADIFIVFPTDTDRGPGRAFDDADIRAVERQISGVLGAAGSVQSNAIAFHNGQDWTTTVQGADPEFFEAQSIDVIQGRGFTDSEASMGKSVCILGPKVVEEIFVENEVLGEQMRIGNVSCQVIGVIDERASAVGGGNDANDIVYMPLKTVQRRFVGGTDVQFFVVKYDGTYTSGSVQESLVDLLRERRTLQDGQENDFNIIDTAEINDTVNQVTGVMTLVVTAIAAITVTTAVMVPVTLFTVSLMSAVSMMLKSFASPSWITRRSRSRSISCCWIEALV